MRSLSRFRTEVTVAYLEELKDLSKDLIPMCITIGETIRRQFKLEEETTLEIANALITEFLDAQRQRWDGFLKYIGFKPKLSFKEVNELVKSLTKER